jgi:hypothetical protein
MKICERCSDEHDGSYGTGRYCSKKCAFTKNENQLIATRKPKSEETKQRMRKSKKDSSKMGKYDKSGSNNPNSIKNNGHLKDRSGNQYDNVCKSNKINGLGWTDEHKKNHSYLMLGDSNWMRNKNHSIETKLRISETKLEQYRNGEVKINKNCISRGEIEISKYLDQNGIEYQQQFAIKGFGFRYDFYIPKFNIILEYNGDYWHTNPEIYHENKIVDGKSAKDIWEKDNLKKKIAEDNGYRFYTIWERDYRPGYKNEYNNSLILKVIEDNEDFVFGS